MGDQCATLGAMNISRQHTPLLSGPPSYANTVDAQRFVVVGRNVQFIEALPAPRAPTAQERRMAERDALVLGAMERFSERVKGFALRAWRVSKSWLCS